MSGNERPSSAARVRHERKNMIMRAAEEGMSNLVLLALDESEEDRYSIADGDGSKDVPLVTACLRGHLEVVRNLMERGHASVHRAADVTIDGTEYTEVPPLWAATESRNVQLVRYLLQHGANVNQTNSTQSTPLRVAVFHGHVTLVDCLLENGADVNSINSKGHSVLMNSCQNEPKFSEIVERLLKKGVDVNYAIGTTGKTALHQAASSGAVEIGKLLLKNGATLSRNHEGETPLMVAAIEAKDDFVELMLDLSDCSRDDRADGLELLGTAYWIKDQREKCVGSWDRAMKERHPPGKPVAEKRLPEETVAVYGHAVEAKTPQSLQKLKLSGTKHDLGIQSMLIRERILGKENEDTIHIIKYAAAVHADEENFTRSIELLVHALENLSSVFPFVTHVLQVYRFLVSVMAESEGQEKATPFPLLLKALKKALVDFQHGEEARRKENNDACLDICQNMLKIILHMLCLLQKARQRASTTEHREFSQVLSTFVKSGARGQAGDTLLHMACKGDTTKIDTSDGGFEACEFPSLFAVQALLEAGCDVTARNETRETALQVLRKQSGDHSAITKLLMEAGSK